MDFEANKKCLSAISFKNLISLNLQGFRLDDGAYLLPVIGTLSKFIILKNISSLLNEFQIIKQCPNLERILLDGKIVSIPSFVVNFGHFLKKATKLRDVR